jgi:peptide/nickel transport system ATP-binding protein
VTLRALCGLIPPPGRVVAGSLTVDGKSRSWTAETPALRGNLTSMIFQDPATSLNPVRSVGSQLVEVLRVIRQLPRRKAITEAVDLLGRVGIPEPDRRMHVHPHELSGGMRQRVMIALALATRPRLLLADEPTTALDVTTQEQILALLKSLQDETGMAMIFVTHDLAVARDVCDDVLVLYAGYVVERGAAEVVIDEPCHPYTRGLVAAVPELDGSIVAVGISGQPPNMAQLPPGCPFSPRCAMAIPECSEVDMARTSRGSCACPYVAPAVAARSDARHRRQREGHV